TNITEPLVSVITNVSLEHTRILGDTVEKIAGEKAGIIKENGILVSASKDKNALSVFEKVCKQKKCKMLRLGKEIVLAESESSMAGQIFSVSVNGKTYNQLSIPLAGAHQLENAACAVGAVHALDLRGITLPERGVRMGLRRVAWPGRLETIRGDPLVVIDCAKDPEAMKRLAETVDTMEHAKLILVLGISADKNIKKMADAIMPKADLVIATAHKVMDRAAEPGEIAKHAARHKKECIIIDDVQEAVGKAIELAGKNDLVLITGSLFTVGEARELWESKEKGEKSLGRDFNEIPKK
ncbi:MAG: Mur ligase family protein, partial [Candidatus Micrarchaeota archaeon]